MKHNLTNLLRAILLCIVMVFSSCENEELETGNVTPSISNAKNWFEEFQAKENFYPIFSDLIYNWQDASITNLTNGSQAIKVPVLFPNESTEYYGHKIIYLYPNNSGKGFDASLFEFIPNQKKVKTAQEKIDLNTYDGYIIYWDLVKGFVRGSKFEDNLAINDINLKVIYSKNNNTHKEAPTINLDEVVIIKPRSNNNGAGYTFVITGSYAPLGTGTTSGNYANSYHGGGGAAPASNSATDTAPSCESFNFNSKKGSLWQESAVKNIHFNIVVISPNGYRFSQIINYPNAILFGAPTNLAIGNTDISAGLAATLSAKAVEASMSETVSMYGNKPVSELTVRLYFEERLKHNYPLFIPGGRVNFNASAFSGIPTDYKTNMFGTGNCN